MWDERGTGDTRNAPGGAGVGGAPFSPFLIPPANGSLTPPPGARYGVASMQVFRHQIRHVRRSAAFAASEAEARRAYSDMLIETLIYAYTQPRAYLLVGVFDLHTCALVAWRLYCGTKTLRSWGWLMA